MAQQNSSEDICAEGGKMETEFIELYRARHDSEEYKQYIKLENEFFEKAHYYQYYGGLKIKPKEEITEWILNNVEKTAFGSVEVAKVEIANHNKRGNERMMRDSHIRDFTVKCVKQCPDAYKRVISKMMDKYGKFFRP